MPGLPAALLLVLVAGCTPRGPAAPTDRDVVVSTRLVASDGGTIDVTTWDDSHVVRTLARRPPDALWPRLGEVYRALGLEPNAVDTDARVLGVQGVRAARIGGRRPSHFVRCGIGPTGQIADTEHLTLTVLTELQPTEGGGSLVRTRMEAYSRDRVHSSHPSRWGTTGRLEREIARMLEEKGGA